MGKPFIEPFTKLKSSERDTDGLSLNDFLAQMAKIVNVFSLSTIYHLWLQSKQPSMHGIL